jgi:drug/metabolite transporter (DMT)-like permease
MKPYTDVKKGTFKLQFWRANIAACFFMAYTQSLTLIPIGMAVIILNMAPFWTTLLGRVFNKEKIFLVEILGMFICFSCIIALTLQTA